MKVRCEARNVYQDKSTGNVSYGPWLPCRTGVKNEGIWDIWIKNC